MNRFFCFIPFVLICCSSPKQKGKRVSLAGGNISFVLPDSALVYGKPFLWGACTTNGAYDEAGANYFSPDSTIRVFSSVKAMSDNFLQETSWHKLADPQWHKQVIAAKNRGQAIIQQIIADSLTRTLEIDYSVPKRTEKGWRGQSEFTKMLTVYGRHRRLEFTFSAPDTKVNRQRLSISRASLFISPAYLTDSVKSYSQSRSEH